MTSPRPIISVLSSSQSGYWGTEPGSNDCDVRIVRNGDVNNDSIDWAGCPVRSVSSTEYQRARLLPNDILLTTSGNCGHVAYVDSTAPADVAASNFVRILRVHSDVVPRYLYYLMDSERFRSMLSPFIRGTTMKNLSVKSAFETVKLPVPSIAKQKKIACILDAADSVRRRRSAAARLGDELIMSIFVDMFGDPATNPKGWKVGSMSSHGVITTGNTPSRKRPEYYGDYLEWIKSDNINTPSHILTRATEKLSRDGVEVCRWVPSGSTLVTCIAGSPSCIGNAAMTDRRVAFNQQINAITPNEDTDPHFLYVMIVVLQRVIQRSSTNAMKGMVSKTQFSKIPTICPQQAMQRQFGDCVRQQLDVLNKYDTARRGSEDLFKAIVQQAFRGEL